MSGSPRDFMARRMASGSRRIWSMAIIRSSPGFSLVDTDGAVALARYYIIWHQRGWTGYEMLTQETRSNGTGLSWTRPTGTTPKGDLVQASEKLWGAASHGRVGGLSSSHRNEGWPNNCFARTSANRLDGSSPNLLAAEAGTMFHLSPPTGLLQRRLSPPWCGCWRCAVTGRNGQRP